ncbi:MAG: carbohydrate ABC transporter permease [Lachnospiraceae bacterium]|nr:carbohydrate ABC transporter permease [Lachnospiraceae bacterium]
MSGKENKFQRNGDVGVLFGKIRRWVIRIFFYLLLFSLSFVFLYPFIIMIVDSFKSDADLANITVKWIPEKLVWNNYVIAFKQLSYQIFVKNSLVMSVIATIGHVLSCSFVGYGFARYRFRGRGVLFGIVILSMLVPIQVLIFPLYIQYSKWGWLDSYLPLLVPTFFGYGLNGAFFIFLFRQFFSSLPYEMEEAARIDGCGALRAFFKIMLPMSKSSLLVATVLSFVWHWNDYFEPNMYIRTISKQLLPSRLPLLYSLLNSEDSLEAMVEEGGLIFNEAMLMAATFLVILPVLIVYAFLQKKFMEGIERSGLTGM